MTASKKDLILCNIDIFKCKKITSLIITLLFSFLSIGWKCGNTNDNGNNYDYKSAVGSLALYLSTPDYPVHNAKKTIIPDLDMNIDHYNIFLSGQNNEIINQKVNNSGNIIIEDLTIGDWEITVTAMNLKETAIGTSGDEPVIISISPHQTSECHIEITHYEGLGTLHLSISWDTNKFPAASISGILESSNNTMLPIEFFLTNGVNTYENDKIPSGYYTLTIALLNENEISGSAVEVVQILTNELTMGSIILITPPVTEPPISDEVSDSDGEFITNNHKILNYPSENTFQFETKTTKKTYTYTWSIEVQPSGSNPILSNDNAVNPIITIDAEGFYIIKLVVDDGDGYTTIEYVYVGTLLVVRYIRAGASGSGNGLDWTNAWNDLPSTLTRGYTYYIADGNYGSYTFNDDEDGIVPIFIKKAVEAEHGTEDGWNISYDSGQVIFSGSIDIATSYLEINGQRGFGDIGSTYGIKVLYDTDIENNALISSPTAINASYVKFKYIEFQQSGIDHTPDIKSMCFDVDNISYWTISHCYIHDSNSALTVFSNGVEHLTVEYSWFTERHTNGRWHGSALVINDPGQYNGSIIRYNVFKNIAGTCIIEPKNNNSEENWSHICIYGNLFYSTSPYYNPSVAICDVASNPGESSYIYIFNNTFVNITNASVTWKHNQGNNNNLVQNNLYFNCSTIEFSGTAHDFNAFELSKGENNEQIGITSAIFTDYSNYDFTLATGTMTGELTIFDKDMNDNVRGEDGIWDRGAFEFIGGK